MFSGQQRSLQRDSRTLNSKSGPPQDGFEVEKTLDSWIAPTAVRNEAQKRILKGEQAKLKALKNIVSRNALTAGLDDEEQRQLTEVFRLHQNVGRREDVARVLQGALGFPINTRNQQDIVRAIDARLDAIDKLSIEDIQKKFASIDEEYFKDWYKWMIGRGRDAEYNPERTPWGRQIPHNPEVISYIRSFPAKKGMFMAKLAELRFRGPQSVEDYFLWYKYFVRLPELGIDPNDEYLNDWSMFFPDEVNKRKGNLEEKFDGDDEGGRVGPMVRGDRDKDVKPSHFDYDDDDRTPIEDYARDNNNQTNTEERREKGKLPVLEEAGEVDQPGQGDRPLPPPGDPDEDEGDESDDDDDDQGPSEPRGPSPMDVVRDRAFAALTGQDVPEPPESAADVDLGGDPADVAGALAASGAEFDELRNRIAEMESSADQRNLALAAAQQSSQELGAQIQEKVDYIAELEGTVEALTGELQGVQDCVNNLHEQLAAQAVAAQAREQELLEANNVLADQMTELDVRARGQIARVRAEASRTIDALKGSLKKKEDEHAAVIDELKTLRAELAAARRGASLADSRAITVQRNATQRTLRAEVGQAVIAAQANRMLEQAGQVVQRQNVDKAILSNRLAHLQNVVGALSRQDPLPPALALVPAPTPTAMEEETEAPATMGEEVPEATMEETPETGEKREEPPKPEPEPAAVPSPSKRRRKEEGEEVFDDETADRIEAEAKRLANTGRVSMGRNADGAGRLIVTWVQESMNELIDRQAERPVGITTTETDPGLQKRLAAFQAFSAYLGTIYRKDPWGKLKKSTEELLSMGARVAPVASSIAKELKISKFAKGLIERLIIRKMSKGSISRKWAEFLLKQASS